MVMLFTHRISHAKFGENFGASTLYRCTASECEFTDFDFSNFTKPNMCENAHTKKIEMVYISIFNDITDRFQLLWQMSVLILN